MFISTDTFIQISERTKAAPHTHTHTQTHTNPPPTHTHHTHKHHTHTTHTHTHTPHTHTTHTYTHTHTPHTHKHHTPHTHTHTFLSSALDGGVRSTSSSGRFTPKNEPMYPLNMKLSGLHSRSGTFWRKRTAGHPVRSLCTNYVMVAPLRHHNKYEIK